LPFQVAFFVISVLCIRCVLTTFLLNEDDDDDEQQKLTYDITVNMLLQLIQQGWSYLYRPCRRIRLDYFNHDRQT